MIFSTKDDFHDRMILTLVYYLPIVHFNAKYDHIRYAGTVMEVCKVNEELNRQLEEVVHCFIVAAFFRIKLL